MLFLDDRGRSPGKAYIVEASADALGNLQQFFGTPPLLKFSLHLQEIAVWKIGGERVVGSLKGVTSHGSIVTTHQLLSE